MAFSKEELLKLENPYEELSTGDQLAEHADALNALSEKEQLTLATKIIADCPAVKFKNYSNHIKALSHLKKGETTFHNVLSDAYQVRLRILSLSAPQNSHPHTVFGQEFTPELFHRFADLSQLVLKGNEQAIAERLASFTPSETRSEISRNIEIAFPKSALSTNIKLAFALRHNIDTLLLGDKPEQFFTSRDFNKDTCTMFVGMFRTLLKDKEAQIAQKLSSIESSETQAKVRRDLDLLHTEAFDETNPFKLIAKAMIPLKSAEKPVTFLGLNPYGFNRPPTPPRPKGETDGQQVECELEVYDSEEDEYDNKSPTAK